MNQKKILFILSFIILTLLSLYFLFSDRNAGMEDSDSAALSSLLAGNSSRINAQHKESLFDSEFWSGGVPDRPIEEGLNSEGDGDSELLEPTDPDNPINPQSGLPFSNSDMEEFDALRKKFPNNGFIPRRRTPEERADEQKHLLQNTLQMHSNVMRPGSTPEEINRYYDSREKPIRDRMEIFEYALKESGESMSPDIKEQFEKVLDNDRRQLTALEGSRQKTLSAGGGWNGAARGP